MKHLTGILIYNKDIPKELSEALENNFSDKINIDIESDRQKFLSKIQDNNLYIINSMHKSLLDQELLKCIVVTTNTHSVVENEKNDVIFDPYRNEDRTLKDFTKTTDTFVKTVEYCINLFRIPVTPDDSIQTILALD